MENIVDAEIGKLAEQYRSSLPDGFLAERDAVAADLAAGRLIDPMRARGQGSALNRTISKLVLAELSLLLCTEDPRYENLRQSAQVVAMTVASTIGKVVSTELGLAQEAATGCVVFLWQVCRKIGVDRFCQLCPPQHDE